MIIFTIFIHVCGWRISKLSNCFDRAVTQIVCFHWLYCTCCTGEERRPVVILPSSSVTAVTFSSNTRSLSLAPPPPPLPPNNKIEQNVNYCDTASSVANSHAAAPVIKRPPQTIYHRWLTTSEFVCTTEQRDRSIEKKFEKAIDLAYTTLMHVQLCCHAQLIMWLAHCILCKQQLISCRLQLAYMHVQCSSIDNTYAVSQKLL